MPSCIANYDDSESAGDGEPAAAMASSLVQPPPPPAAAKEAEGCRQRTFAGNIERVSGCSNIE